MIPDMKDKKTKMVREMEEERKMKIEGKKKKKKKIII
jgi:hypothetical protein